MDAAAGEYRFLGLDPEPRAAVEERFDGLMRGFARRGEDVESFRRVSLDSEAVAEAWIGLRPDGDLSVYFVRRGGGAFGGSGPPSPVGWMVSSRERRHDPWLVGGVVPDAASHVEIRAAEAAPVIATIKSNVFVAVIEGHPTRATVYRQDGQALGEI